MTHDQLALLETHELILPAHEPGQTLEQRFRQFIAANAWLVGAYEALTLEYIAGGARRVSINMLTEVLRYRAGRTQGEPWKINNSFRSYMVRLLISKHPEWDGLFETRAMPSLRNAS